MPRYKLTLSYDGTAYAGWQVQPNGVTIQELLERTLKLLLGSPIRVTGSGRTDSGVHAYEQVAHFDSQNPLDSSRIHHSLNKLLPPDIRILKLEECSDTFHARFSARGKIYRYHIYLDPIRSPFKTKTSHHVKGPFDLELLKRGAEHFIGTHDFRSFTNESSSQKKSTTRTIYRLDVIEEPGGLYLEFEGNGFLYKMVRNIVGTLLDIAQGKIALEELKSVFEKRDRRAAGRAAPPQALFLVKVIYP